ncbi:hypothetical protein [Sphingobacterium hungaricum]
MKKLILLIAVIFAGLSISFAQQRGGGGRDNSTPEQRAQKEVEKLNEKLALNQAQKDSVYKYALESAQAQNELFKNAGGDREAAMSSMKDLNTKKEAKIKAILTPEQLPKFEEFQKENKGRGAGRGR